MPGTSYPADWSTRDGEHTDDPDLGAIYGPVQPTTGPVILRNPSNQNVTNLGEQDDDDETDYIGDGGPVQYPNSGGPRPIETHVWTFEVASDYHPEHHYGTNVRDPSINTVYIRHYQGALYPYASVNIQGPREREELYFKIETVPSNPNISIYNFHRPQKDHSGQETKIVFRAPLTLSRNGQNILTRREWVNLALTTGVASIVDHSIYMEEPGVIKEVDDVLSDDPVWFRSSVQLEIRTMLQNIHPWLYGKEYRASNQQSSSWGA